MHWNLSFGKRQSAFLKFKGISSTLLTHNFIQRSKSTILEDINEICTFIMSYVLLKYHIYII